MSCRDSASVQVRANAICPTAAAPWLSSSASSPAASLSTARPSAMAPEDTTRMSRLPACSPAMSAASDASHFSLSRPPLASTKSEEPILTTIRRKSPSRGVFIAGFMAGFYRMPGRSGYRFPVCLTFPGADGSMHLELGLVLQQHFVLQAIIAGKAADQLAPLPVVEDAADIFTGNAGHGGKIALPDLLADDDAAGTDILAEILRQFEQRAGDTAAQRQKAPGRHCRVGFAQPRRDQGQQGPVDLRMFVGEFLECGSAEKAQLCWPHRDHGGRSRQSVDKGQFADDGAGTEKSEDALGAGPRHHRDLEQSILDAIAAVAGVVGEEQDLVGFKPDRRRVVEQACRKMLGQSRQQTRIVAGQSHGTSRGSFGILSRSLCAKHAADLRKGNARPDV